jgi:hypothetical protein
MARLEVPRVPIEGTSSYIRNALSNASSTKDVQVAGVGTTKTGYVIRFKNQQSTDTARANPEWLETLGNGIKLVKPRYGEYRDESIVKIADRASLHKYVGFIKKDDSIPFVGLRKDLIQFFSPASWRHGPAPRQISEQSER